MNVEELLSSKKIEYRVSGQDFLVRCLNPEHDDTHPSMRIDSILGIFQCMSCGFKGNIFKFYEEEAGKLDLLREKVRRKIRNLRSESVGLAMPEGYTPYLGNWRNIDAKTYIKFEAFRHHSPEFQGRIVFPIRDISGRIVVFLGRDELGTLDKKYLFYPRHVKIPLYPLTAKKLYGRLILVEGIFDCMNLYDKGLYNAVSIFGTRTPEEYLKLLKIQGVEGLDIILDPDEAGQKGAKRIKEEADNLGFATRNIVLPEGRDPGSLNKPEVLKLKSKLYG